MQLYMLWMTIFIELCGMINKGPQIGHEIFLVLRWFPLTFVIV